MTSSIPKIVRTDRIPHEDIDPDALKVIGRLRRFGHEAYLVGGCVRDLLLGAHPKDFDVITSARPRQVRRIFSNSRVIGRRFRLVHVIFGQNIIEVSTFRADPGEFAEKAKLEAEAAQAAASEESAPPPASAEAGAPPVESATDLPETGPDSPAPEAAEPDSPAPAALTPIEAAAQLSPEESEPVDAPDEPEALSPPEEDEEAELDEDDEEEEPVSPDPLPAGGGRAPAEPPSELRSREPSREEDEDDESTWDRRRGRRRRPRPEFDGNNIFGTPEEDARRRDFTINAIFYDPEHRELVDYVSGLEDIERGLINPINDPLRSLAEDPVRIIRAVRFAAKLGFKIEDTALRAIEEKRKLIAECSQRRLLEEIFKILKGGHASASFRLMEDLGILEFLLPEIADWLAKAPSVPRLASPAADTVPVPDSAPVTDTVPVTDTATDTVPVIDTVSVSAPVTAAAPLPEAAPVTEMVAPPPAEAPAPEPAEIKLGPIPAWEPPTRAIEAYLRVTWEHPPKEGPNDWVEDPHEEVVDAIFEAAAFARDVVLERFGFRSLAGEASERQRARAVMKVLQLNGRLTDAIAWVEEQGRPPPGALLERSERRGRN
ncbi:hypothetical protein HY251_15510, partial [bacterium]|nr:hypothetical protein [bacterium]